MQNINYKQGDKMKKIQKIILSLIPFTGLFAEEAVMAVGKLAAPFGAGFVVIGAGIGIGMLASAAANATARQPEAANEIRTAANLPLFLLEGVAIIALVVCLLASF
jgi:F-type H+-transporting ATPase subunit c